jgi:hypothetical protein
MVERAAVGSPFGLPKRIGAKADHLLHFFHVVLPAHASLGATMEKAIRQAP